MIELHNLSMSYSLEQTQLNVLDGLNLSVANGETVAIVGPSGSGKTTLLKILFRWETVDRGQVLVHGFNVSKLQEDKLYQVRRKIGVVFQDYKLLPRKTVFENVAFAQEIIGSPIVPVPASKERRERVRLAVGCV